MTRFIPVRYSSHDYPPGMKPEPKVQEATANFFNFNKHRDALQKIKLRYISLHTDPGYRGRKDMFFSPDLQNEFPEIFNRENVFDFETTCVSKLWFNEKWSKEFSGFLVRLTEGIEDRSKIKVIEIHPPFKRYCDSLKTFLKMYSIFEQEALKEFPSATIHIENRVNANHKRKGGKFILSTKEDILELAGLILNSPLKLKLVVDIPQLLSEHFGNRLLTKEEIREVLTPLRDVRSFINGTHIWGYDIKKGSGGQHSVDLRTFFNDDEVLTGYFVNEVIRLFDDGRARYFVPEVGSTTAVQSIVQDLIEGGIEFVDPE